MEQKEYINVDKLFQNWHDRPLHEPSDSAWEKMNAILNKEMPQQEKRKRKWFIPLMGLLCTIGGTAIGVGVSSYYYSNNNNNNNDYQKVVQSHTPKQTTATASNTTNIDQIAEDAANQLLNSSVVKNTDPATIIEHSDENNKYISKSKNYANNTLRKAASKKRKISKQGLTHLAQNNLDAQAIGTILNEYNTQVDNNIIHTAPDQRFDVEENKSISLQKSFKDYEVLVASAYIKSPVGLEYIKYDGTWFKKIDAPKTFKISNKKYISDNHFIETEGEATIKTSELVPLSLDYTIGGSVLEKPTEAIVENRSENKSGQTNTFWEDLQLRSNPFIAWLFSNHSFNPIINAGIHYSSTFSGAMGYNIGFGVKYNLKQHIKINALLNYQHTFLGNYIYTDHASQYNVTQNGNIYSGEEIIEENYYTLKSIQQLQLPILLNYHFVKDFYLTAGANLSYTLPINYNTDSYKKINENYASMVAPMARPAAIDVSKDFNKNIGVGYILGFGYNANKRMQIDLKMQQMMYNSNIKQSYLGKDLYGKPSFNLQFTYNLGKK